MQDSKYGDWWILVAGLFVATFLIAAGVGTTLFRWLHRAKRSFASDSALIDLFLCVALIVLGEGLNVDFYSKALVSLGLGFLAPALGWAGILWFAIGLVRYFRAEGFGPRENSRAESQPVSRGTTEARIR